VNDEDDIPTLTDLIEEPDAGDHIAISDLGLDDGDTEIEISDSDLLEFEAFLDNPALEQTVRRILDEHMELAWQEIKIAIQKELDKS
jgi:hypothetical protein